MKDLAEYMHISIYLLARCKREYNAVSFASDQQICVYGQGFGALRAKYYGRVAMLLDDYVCQRYIYLCADGFIGLRITNVIAFEL